MRRPRGVLSAATQRAMDVDQALRIVDRRQGLLNFQQQKTALGIEHGRQILSAFLRTRSLRSGFETSR